MTNRGWMVMGLGLLLAGTRPVAADVWDIETVSDNNSGTRNELVHGSDQVHDLGALSGPAADEDWFQISQKSYSSYEIVVDGTSGDIGTVALERIASDGTTSQAPFAQGTGVGFSQSLRWTNDTATSVDGEWIRVKSGGCTTDCGSDDVYRIRMYETTTAIPRFNNSGSQVTVLLLQNPTPGSISGIVYFWSTTGSQLGTFPFTLASNQILVKNTSQVVAGLGGAVTITHNGRYGDLAGKTVALEPSTGFSFDSPMLARPH